jgi:F-type H+-transporting ATPase subunit gamma
MTRLADIEAHIATMGDLLDTIGAMRSLAGMRMQEAQRALPGVRLYAQSVAAGLADTLALLGEPEPLLGDGGHLALILCAAEHGFVGGFNERLVGAARAELGPGDLLFVVGSRGTALAIEQGREPVWTQPMATRCAAAPEAVQHVTDEIYRRISGGEIARVEVIHARYSHDGPPVIARRRLLPVDLAALAAVEPRMPPLHNLEPVVLHERLMGEFVFALLTEATVESIASENAARLAAMEAAHDNVSERLEQLRREARQARQSEITAELLELVTGSEALGATRHA